MTPESTPSHSIPALLRELRDESTTLLRQEVALAKTELKENAARLGQHASQVAIGGFVAYAGVIVLLIGLGHLLGTWLIRLGLDPDVAQWLAPAVVGLIVAVIGFGMLTRARRALAQDEIIPDDTVASMRATKRWAAGKLTPSS